MNTLLLFAAIVTAFVGNLSSSPNQSSPAHEQQVTRAIPEEPLLIAGAIENPPRGEPASAPTPEVPKGYASPEGALVVVGIITCGVILWQSWETRRSANAALRNVEAIVNEQRAWVTVTPKRNGTIFGLVLKNAGITPARLISLTARYDYFTSTDDLPMPPTYKDFTFVHKRLVLPGAEWEPEKAGPMGQEVGVDMAQLMADGDVWPDVIANRKFIMFWGKLTYLDISEKMHETRFCFWFNPIQAEWWISGPEGYNENT